MPHVVISPTELGVRQSRALDEWIGQSYSMAVLTDYAECTRPFEKVLWRAGLFLTGLVAHERWPRMLPSIGELLSVAAIPYFVRLHAGAAAEDEACRKLADTFSRYDPIATDLAAVTAAFEHELLTLAAGLLKMGAMRAECSEWSSDGFAEDLASFVVLTNDGFAGLTLGAPELPGSPKGEPNPFSD